MSGNVKNRRSDINSNNNYYVIIITAELTINKSDVVVEQQMKISSKITTMQSKLHI